MFRINVFEWIIAFYMLVMLFYYTFDYDRPRPISKPILLNVALREPLKAIILIIFSSHFLGLNNRIIEPTPWFTCHYRRSCPKMGIFPPYSPTLSHILKCLRHLFEVYHRVSQLKTCEFLIFWLPLVLLVINIVNYANEVWIFLVSAIN